MARLCVKFKGLFTHFIVVLSRFILDFAHFIAISSHLVANFSYFIVVLIRLFVAFSHLFIIAFRFIIVLTHIFTHKRHFLGHCVFLKFLNALFLGFLRSSLQAVFVKTADFVILSAAKNPHKLKENLPFLDTSFALSMTKFMTQRVFGMTRQIGMINLGCRLNFLKQMKNLKNSKNLQIFLKIFC